MGCNILAIYTVQQVKIPDPQTVKLASCRHPVAEDTFATSLHPETTKRAFVARSLYGYRAPGCFTVFL